MRSNRDKDLEGIINEMYTHKIEVPANNTVGEDEQYNAPNITDPELTSGGDELVVNINIGDETHDGVKINIMDPVNVDLAKGTITFELESTEEEATDTDEDPVDESGCNSNRKKKKKTITAAHCK